MFFIISTLVSVTGWSQKRTGFQQCINLYRILVLRPLCDLFKYTNAHRFIYRGIEFPLKRNTYVFVLFLGFPLAVSGHAAELPDAAAAATYASTTDADAAVHVSATAASLCSSGKSLHVHTAARDIHLLKGTSHYVA